MKKVTIIAGIDEDAWNERREIVRAYDGPGFQHWAQGLADATTVEIVTEDIQTEISANAVVRLPMNNSIVLTDLALAWVDEQISVEPPYNSWRCLCGNVDISDGFYPCDPVTGAQVEPDIEGDAWDGVHYVCARCGRIIDQNTLVVTGKRTS